MFRSLIDQHVKEYEMVSTRIAKTIIVTTIYETFENRSVDCKGGMTEEGGFVRQDDVTGRWYEVGEGAAREKIGQSLREKLHIKYRSSTKAKRRKWKEINKEAVDVSSSIRRTQELAVDKMIHAVSLQMMNTLSITLKEIVGNGAKDDPAFDERLEEEMTRVNCLQLEQFKQMPSNNHI